MAWLLRCCLAAVVLGIADGLLALRSHEAATNPAGPHGRGVYSKHCHVFPGKRVVLVTVSSGFLDLFYNWLHFAQPYLWESEQLVVMAEDEGARAELAAFQNSSNVSFSLGTPDARGAADGTTSSALDYGNREYGNLVWRRPTYLTKLLNQDCTVLYVDIDTAWARDPFLEIGSHPGSFMYLVQDDPEGGVHGGAGSYLCTCFMYLQPAPTVRYFIGAWGHSWTGKANKNQFAFNRVLRSLGGSVEYEVLPVEHFPPGSHVKHYPNATVVHANWVKGHTAKVCLLNSQGVWHGGSEHLEHCDEEAGKKD